MSNNDTTTIAGCMQEAIDRLENNLAKKGVTAIFNANDGYFDLLDKILDISRKILLTSNKNIIQEDETITFDIKTKDIDGVNNIPNQTVYITSDISDENLRIKLSNNSHFVQKDDTTTFNIDVYNRNLTKIPNAVIHVYNDTDIDKITYYDDCTGIGTSFWTTSPTYTTYDGYSCFYGIQSLGKLPTTSHNITIEMDMYGAGSWGGVIMQDRYDNQQIPLVWYAQGVQYNDQECPLYAKIIPNTWNKLKTVIREDTIYMYLNNEFIGFYTYSIRGDFFMTSGSSVNPLYLKEIKIRED